MGGGAENTGLIFRPLLAIERWNDLMALGRAVPSRAADGYGSDGRLGAQGQRLVTYSPFGIVLLAPELVARFVHEHAVLEEHDLEQPPEE